ncbi:MAG: hypothetical protein KAJ93_08655 [Methanosarcinales archaeon]|nr:hypothetical protein [Methanosarcinales archaeon]
MIVTDGVLWINSKDVRAVGKLNGKTFPVFLQGINGTANLNFPTIERACAIRIRLILDLDSKDKNLIEVSQYLMLEAAAAGLNMDDVRKHLKEFIAK